MKQNIKKNISMYVAVLSVLLFPVVSFAALDGLKGLLKDVGDILILTKPLLFGLAFLYFFWGMGQFILHSGEQKTRDEGKQKMIWGIIALFVMMSILGLISFIGSSIGITPTMSF